MSFQKLELLPVILICLAIFFLISIRSETEFFKWVRTFWFHKQTRMNRLSSFVYYLGFLFISLALLDPRGPEKRVMGKVGDQKTIVLIDTSASMLAEDVRPNRFEKAVLLAKHFIKKAVGHQISVVVFSDGQKRLIPFTSDKDLIEARLNTLEDLDLDRGGTGLSLAIQESIQYFINSEKKPFGNMIIFTDAEETEDGLKLDVPDGISVAVVGIGTAKGAPIPERNRRGVFKGNKKYKGQTVISKLNEDYLKSIGNKVDHFKYWIASSYTIPTEQILSFFNRSLKTKLSKNDFRIRPVLANWFLVPGVLLLLVAFLLKNFRSFIPIMGLILAIAPEYGNSQVETEKMEPPPKSEMTLQLEERLSKNELDRKGKEKLALELLKSGRAEQAKKLYDELLPNELDEDSKKALLNYGAAQFESGDLIEGMKTYDRLMNYLKENQSPENKELLNKSKKNVLKAIQVENQKQKQKKQQSKKGKEGQKGEKGQEGHSGGSGDQEDQENKGKQEKGEQDQESGQGPEDKNRQKNKNEGSESEKDKKNQSKEDQDKDNQDKDNQGKENQDKSDQGDKEKKSSGRPDQGDDKDVKKKMPSILKQLMSDDNNLQKKAIDADTVKRKTRDKKDW